MLVQYPLILTLFILAILISINAGVYLVARYRTRLAVWCGLVLFSQAIELVVYLLRLTKPATNIDLFLYFIQVISYTLVCFFWLLFVLFFARRTQWTRPRNLAILIALPAIYLILMLVNGIRGTVYTPLQGGEVGSVLLTSRYFMGIAGALLFLVYGYGIAFLSIFALFTFYAKANTLLRKLILAILVGPVIMALVGIIELVGANPLKPISIHQLGLSAVSFLAVWMILDLRFGNVLANASDVVIDQIQDGVLILDQRDQIIYANPAAQQIIGQSNGNLLRHPLSQVWPTGASLIADRFSEDTPSGEVTISGNGLDHTFDINISQLLDVYREPIGRTIVLRNVTGRERMQKALDERSQELQRANALLSALAEVNVTLQTTTDPVQIYTMLGEELKKLGLVCFILQLDPATNELYTSYFSVQSTLISQVAMLLGFKPTGYHLDRGQFGTLYAILESKEPSYRELYHDDLLDSPGKVPAILLEQAVRMLGLKPEMATLVLPLITGEGAFGLLGIWGEVLRAEDIPSFRIFASQVAHVIEKAILYEKEKQRADELERFTYTVSHDLKAPLITIRGFMGFVEKDALAGNLERLKSDIERINEATDKMQRLLNELLSLSRVGRMMNPPQTASFEEIVKEAIELVHGRSQERGVQFQVAPSLPAVHGDRERLIQVVQNLVDNAIKFMGAQPDPRIEVGCCGDEDGKPVFYVKDNGIGIAPEFHERVFGLFNKLDQKSEGNGVGLALVRRIIEVHRGRIWIESDGLGRGATFYFTLPGK